MITVTLTFYEKDSGLTIGKGSYLSEAQDTQELLTELEKMSEMPGFPYGTHLYRNTYGIVQAPGIGTGLINWVEKDLYTT